MWPEHEQNKPSQAPQYPRALEGEHSVHHPRALVRQDAQGQLETYLELSYTLENGVKTILELPDNGRAVS